MEKYLKVDTRKRMFAERRYFTEPTANRAHDEQTIAKVCTNSSIPSLGNYRTFYLSTYVNKNRTY